MIIIYYAYYNKNILIRAFWTIVIMFWRYYNIIIFASCTTTPTSVIENRPPPRGVKRVAVNERAISTFPRRWLIVFDAYPLLVSSSCFRRFPPSYKYLPPRRVVHWHFPTSSRRPVRPKTVKPIRTSNILLCFVNENFELGHSIPNNNNNIRFLTFFFFLIFESLSCFLKGRFFVVLSLFQRFPPVKTVNTFYELFFHFILMYFCKYHVTKICCFFPEVCHWYNRISDDFIEYSYVFIVQ